ncbi:hypothetical protein BAUCODRAFT_29982 [Baudoinia panamericana UAMH 10762]|uniref:Uncharacterized protein n=1 Tax=Baudoinia panamericana (strain UAMH 10762) TaxID=717646 RepID=M2MRZ5_BAUPA|nr:uncharacterized protein BAUCODRAFT_29982 [Baudoinia panamericana UAMH 10762]EMC99611.1 hypothetical protein BAUCODRAFT_29982 [Baudoinia panamericana UAMH 10762]
MPRRPVKVPQEQHFDALEPPLRQRRFSDRRKSVRPAAHNRISPLTKSQATLTQVGWINTPQITGHGIFGISSDEEGDAYGETRPKKRRKTSSKTSERTESQPSYTQAIRSAPSRRADRLARSAGLEFEVFEDANEPAGTPMEAVAKRRTRRAVDRVQPTDWDLEDNIGCGSPMGTKQSPEIPNSSSQAEGAENAMPRPATTIITPRNVRFVEVPSSQSPASVKLSSQKPWRCRMRSRSPLQERDANVRTPTHAKTQDTSHATPDNKHYPALEEEFADAGTGSPKSIATVTAEPARTLKRTTTVQDSQCDDIDLNSAQDSGNSGWSTTDNFFGHDECLGQYHSIDLDDGLFDPAYSALDRDAARFALRAQTQGHTLVPQVSNSTDTEDDGLLNDEPEQGLPALAGDERPAEAGIVSAEGCDAVAATQPLEARVATPSMECRPTTKPWCDHPSLEEEEERVPSSPPLPRPSQVSTIVPTQASVVAPFAKFLEATPVLNSPSKAAHSWHETASSSPLPLPPWSSPERERFVELLATEGEQEDGLPDQNTVGTLQSLVDFSLPPPPPMSSSSGVRSSSLGA